ncbi:MAG: SURF1 family protein [Anaerolineales bacterium]|nr:SURF1 family protein [Anaerolineales bacterium]
MLLRKMFSRKWAFTTLLVVVGTLVQIRLGIWQLDRLEARRVTNAHYVDMRAMPPLDLNTEPPPSLTALEYRAVKVSGKYDFENQIAVRNQYYDGQLGYHLLTPLLFNLSADSGQAAVLVDRGWIPAEGNSTPTDWRKYDEPGEVQVEGEIRLGEGKPAFFGVEDALPADGSRLEVWNNVDVAKVAAQLSYPLLPAYIQPAIKADDAIPPIPVASEFELTEGSHFGYAMQWFTFAALLFFGYPFYLRKQDLETQ